jgi:Zn finger protein HypA/HybF involved in hydrogenase expression
MNRTISVKCPHCGYVRYDLLHIDHECGGLLLKTERGEVSCRLCGEDMRYDILVRCPACGHERVGDLVNLESERRCEIVKMEIFETIVIVF